MPSVCCVDAVGLAHFLLFEMQVWPAPLLIWVVICRPGTEDGVQV